MTLTSSRIPACAGLRLAPGSMALFASRLALATTARLASLVAFRRRPLIIRVHDARDQRMSHHVAAAHPDYADALDALQRIKRIAQAGSHAGWQIDLGQIASHHHAGALAHPGKPHL